MEAWAGGPAACTPATALSSRGWKTPRASRQEWVCPCASLNTGCFPAWFQIHGKEGKGREFPQSLPPAPHPCHPLLQRPRDTWAVPRSTWRSRRLPRALSLAAAGQAGVCAWPAQPGPSVCAVLAYMQLLEDYSEPQPSMFYQTPQKEHVYQQKNKLLMEVYGFNDSFSTGDAAHDLAPPPALPPKQRQLVSGGPPTSGPGPWACSPAHISPRRSGCSSRAGPCSWDWLVLRMFAFSVDSLFFSLSLLWLQYRPPRKEGVNQSTGQGLCGAICGLDLHGGPHCPSTCTASRGWPCEDQPCGSRRLTQSRLCSRPARPSSFRTLLCQDAV